MELQYDPIEKTEKYKSIENELEEILAVYKDKLTKEADMTFEEFGIMPSIFRIRGLTKKSKFL